MPRNISVLVAMTMLWGLSCQKRSEVKTKPGNQGMAALQPHGPKTAPPTRSAPRPRPAGIDPTRPKLGTNVLDLPNAAGAKPITARVEVISKNGKNFHSPWLEDDAPPAINSSGET